MQYTWNIVNQLYFNKKRPALLMSEQGFSTLAASRSQEKFVQAQTACLQTKLEK